MKWNRWMSRLALVMLVLSWVVCGQQSGTSGTDDAAEFTLHSGTHLVVLDVVVTDKKGHTVAGLARDDFQIFEDGHPQTLKYFEEHAPVDPALVAQEKAALAARLPPNTFTSYEPFTGRPVTLLLLNKLTSLPDYDIEPLRQQMIDVIYRAPAETPFVVYQLDTQLRLIQPVTANRDLLVRAVNQMWLDPTFGVPPAALGVGDLWKLGAKANAEIVLARRKVFDAAMLELSTSFGPAMGRKTLFAFTGGLRCTLSSEFGCQSGGPELKVYLCGVMDRLEQARISLYRAYPGGQAVYGLGCEGSSADVRDVFDTNSHYYTLYYTPTNEGWDGKFRKFKVTLADKNLRPNYRGGYYGRPENAEARHDATRAGSVPDLVAVEAAGPKLDAVPAEGAPAGSEEGVGADATKSAMNAKPVVFTVKVDPADAPGTGVQVPPPSPGNAESEADRRQGYRDYTLHFLVAAAGLRLVRELHAAQAPGSGPYTARLELSAVSYVHGHPADAKTVQVSAAFDSPADPRIAQGAITADLTLQVPEKGPRMLHITVRDAFTGQFSRLDIPAEKIVLPRQ